MSHRNLPKTPCSMFWDTSGYLRLFVVPLLFPQSRHLLLSSAFKATFDPETLLRNLTHFIH